MSIRRGYYFLAGDQYDGPFQTIAEAKRATLNVRQRMSDEVTIRAMVVLEKRDKHGNWQTVH